MYVPGKALILSRLPNQEWFSLDEAAAAAGWSRSFMRNRIKAGDLAAQEYQRPAPARGTRQGTHRTYRIHVDDLVVFIMRNKSDRWGEEVPFRDIYLIVRSWPAWMRKELRVAIDRTLPSAQPSPETTPAP